MHPHAELITHFYDSFCNKDGAAMAACYHPEARFCDPVFPALTATEAGAMWRMFCEGGGRLDVEFRGVFADDSAGGAHWEAHYDFSATDRPVHNRIDARFRFRDGKFIEHVDTFSFWTWSRMALGAPGLLLGWTPIVRGKVQRIARARLDEFIAGVRAPATAPTDTAGAAADP